MEENFGKIVKSSLQGTSIKNDDVHQRSHEDNGQEN